VSVVVFRGVVKRFGSVVALDGVSFEVGERSVHALLGHNGAGKTTSIRLMLGLLRPSSGSVEVLGVDPYKSAEVRRWMGYVGEGEGLYKWLSARDNLTRFCLSKLGDVRECAREIEEVTEMFELGDLLDKKVGVLSAGNRQRVALARAFLGRPRLLILDEPMNKLDPSRRATFKRLLRDYVKKTGATVVYSTHILGDVEETADTVTILRRGKVVYHGPLDKLLASPTAVTVRVIFGRGVDIVVKEFADYVEEVRGSEMRLRFRDMGEAKRFLAAVADLDIQLLEMRKATLEDIYLALAGP